MLEYLINIDQAVFRFFNTAIANPLFDFIMPIITNQNILDSFNLIDPEILDINILNESLFFSTKAGLFKYSIITFLEKIVSKLFELYLP